ncbi:DnaJ C-terminal domain-containing protein [Vreelandella titanicae]|uniref:DnaJ C-terminal domain-containing protein n=1 Tax=Halomonadaceae TaxID=28256 RepID=UPI00034745FB|nr:MULTISPECIES: DnaJ C-terminal domain-containing protein [Halomonas]KIN14878.1 cytochrome C biogenesis protein [Halomonas sp. KHS3]MCD1587622.1 DnaJ domain-containing protein [Halomonas sp. IOP_14]NVE89724.1 DnaJ domain-containing protein [Halomonas titanicae]
MEFKDYYQILGIDRATAIPDIKKAYRKLARKYHPDISKEPDAALRMQEINEAKAVLTDPEKRAAYDQLGEHYRAGQEFRPPPDWDAGFEFSGRNYEDVDLGEFSDFFTDLFSHVGRRSTGSHHRVRGLDRHAKVFIDLRDTYDGATRSVTLHAPQTDPQGHVYLQQHNLKVRIPKGITEGQHIRLAGQGHPGTGGGESGDLYLEIHFTPNPDYRVEGKDVFATLLVAPWEAALGTSLTMPTPSGQVQLKVPKGSQSGRKLRLKGRGIPSSEPGDLYFVLNVVLPPANTDKARQLYESMARDIPFNPRQKR